MTRSWDRLEPDLTDETLIEGLQARVADPLWLLARQWQVGEFAGEDAATPVTAQVAVDHMGLGVLDTPDGRRQSLSGSPLPLEARIEAIPPDPRSAEDVASLTAMTRTMLADPAAPTAPRAEAIWAALQEHYPFRASAYRPDHPLPPATERRLRMLERHAFDPFALAADGGRRLPRGMLPDRWLKRFAEVCAGRGRDIAAKTEAFDAHALSYGGTITSAGGGETVSLSLADYGGGRLDWYSLDRSDPPETPPRAAKIVTRKETGAPAALTYAGQPLSRFWEIEDAAVQFGAISAGPADIARMVVADFAAVGGDDMFVLPVPVDVGHMVRVRSLMLIDSFGRKHEIPDAVTLDRAAVQGSDRGFELFTQGGDDGGSRWLPILPVTANTMNGRALDRVSLRRDEDANLAWAVEEEIEGPFGQPLRRRQAWEVHEPQTLEDGAPWPYRVQTPVPPWWVPLVPERLGAGAQVQLRRARLGAWETLPPETTGPKSRLMDPTRPVTLAEHAVPAAGVRITRHWQVARAYDGRVVLWQSWRRAHGADDRASGLSHDALDRTW